MDLEKAVISEPIEIIYGLHNKVHEVSTFDNLSIKSIGNEL